jgi:hypothetical protein
MEYRQDRALLFRMLFDAYWNRRHFYDHTILLGDGERNAEFEGETSRMKSWIEHTAIDFILDYY